MSDEKPEVPTKFRPRVAFDTFNNKNAPEFTLTLQSKHPEYHYSRLTRTVLCGADESKYSASALDWLFEELAEDGDELVCVRAVDPNSRISSVDSSLEEKQYRDYALDFFKTIQNRNTRNRRVSLALEFAVGKVEDMIKRMIQIYEPSILVVGTRGRSLDGFKGLLPGSISKWSLQHSPVPVIVVRPSQSPTAKAKTRAEPDPRRRHKRAQLTYDRYFSEDDHSGNTSDNVIYYSGATDPDMKIELPHYLRTSLAKQGGALALTKVHLQDQKSASTPELVVTSSPVSSTPVSSRDRPPPAGNALSPASDRRGRLGERLGQHWERLRSRSRSRSRNAG